MSRPFRALLSACIAPVLVSVVAAVENEKVLSRRERDTGLSGDVFNLTADIIDQGNQTTTSTCAHGDTPVCGKLYHILKSKHSTTHCLHHTDATLSIKSSSTECTADSTSIASTKWQFIKVPSEAKYYIKEKASSTYYLEAATTTSAPTTGSTQVATAQFTVAAVGSTKYFTIKGHHGSVHKYVDHTSSSTSSWTLLESTTKHTACGASDSCSEWELDPVWIDTTCSSGTSCQHGACATTVTLLQQRQGIVRREKRRHRSASSAEEAVKPTDDIHDDVNQTTSSCAGDSPHTGKLYHIIKHSNTHCLKHSGSTVSLATCTSSAATYKTDTSTKWLITKSGTGASTRYTIQAHGTSSYLEENEGVRLDTTPTHNAGKFSITQDGTKWKIKSHRHASGQTTVIVGGYIGWDASSASILKPYTSNTQTRIKWELEPVWISSSR